MKKPRKTIKILGVVLIINAVLALIYAEAFFAVKRRAEAVSRAEQELRILQSVSGEGNMLRKLLEKTVAGETILGEYFIAQSDIISFIEEVESLGRISGASVVLSGLREESESALSFNVRIGGGFRSVFHLMNLLDNLPYAIETRRASLRYSEKDGLWEGDLAVFVKGFVAK